MAFPVSNSIPLTGNSLIDGLVQGSSWQFGGGPRVLTYSLNLNDTPSGGGWTTPWIQGLNAALAEWAKVANITFSYDAASSNKTFDLSNADLAFTLTGSDIQTYLDGETVALGVFPDSTFGNLLLAELGYNRIDYPRVEGDVFFDNYHSVYSGGFTVPGTAGFDIILHEIGHALGLKHPTDDGGNGRPTFGSLGISNLLGPAYTIMEQAENAALHVTPMALDIAAIQAIYGANQTYNSGNDTYVVTPFLNTFDSFQNSRTIWDGGGIDTLDVSPMGSFYFGVIDLRPGSVFNQGRLSIAYNVTIENAIGGNSDDYIVGNTTNNVLSGLFGNDQLFGNEGSDTLQGGAGNDVLDGGVGNDTLDGGDGNDIYVVDSGSDSIIDSSGIDTVQTYIAWMLAPETENLTLLGSLSSGTGNSGDNLIMGNSVSNALLRGLGGDDQIYGGAGDDWLEGDDSTNLSMTGNDYIQGDDGNDTVLAGPGDDTVHGMNDTDTIVGEGGNDVLYGDAGIDYVDGRQGNDQLFGGDGNDIIFGDGLTTTYGFGGDTIYGEAGDDILMGESGDHNAPGALDMIYGGIGNDTIYGGSGNDWIFGGDGNDVIDGGDGSDFIVGGAGADILVGSGDSSAVGGPAATIGGDLFSYGSLADGGDHIYGFDISFAAGNDGIDLRNVFDAAGYAGNAPRADGYLFVLQNGVDTTLYVDANGTAGGANLTLLATLHNFTATSLTDSYFIFQ